MQQSPPKHVLEAFYQQSKSEEDLNDFMKDAYKDAFKSKKEDSCPIWSEAKAQHAEINQKAEKLHKKFEDLCKHEILNGVFGAVAEQEDQYKKWQHLLSLARTNDDLINLKLFFQTWIEYLKYTISYDSV